MQPLRFGEIAVQPALDGYLLLNLANVFPGVPQEAWRAYTSGIENGKLRCALTTFIVQTHGRIVLIDTGLGPHLTRFEGECGKLPMALANAGVAPENVDVVVSTHLHFDHVGWNCTEVDGGWLPTFPNARYVVNRREWARWIDVEAGYVARQLRPIDAAGQLELVDDGYEPAPGMRLLGTPGHTPGHVSVLVYDGGDGGVITGDAAHHPAELEHPDWIPAVDEDSGLASKSRLELADRIEAEGLTVLGGHFPEPHCGRIVRVQQRRTYVPLGA